MVTTFTANANESGGKRDDDAVRRSVQKTDQELGDEATFFATAIPGSHPPYFYPY